ncbi:signal transduction histidine kinase [Pedobacter sp. CG_S7]|uniref:sensor histidine kinase n=1 Tax=Pedobacter sp. CG_S7 TaxID=3143930 RepID=UPI0033988481
MKLFTRYNSILLLITSLGLLVIGLLFYRTLSFYLNSQIDRYLEEELMEVKDYSHNSNILPAPYLFDDLVIEYQKTTQKKQSRIFSDTTYFNPKKRLEESARYLKTNVLLNGQQYLVLIIASKVEREEQIKSILLIIILPVMLLLLVLFFINKIVMKSLWSPFTKLLENIKSFNLSQDSAFETIHTPIKEFQYLNDAFLDISLRVRSDYKEIKLFTENASHEMMTPLAVINSKLDTMLQSNNLDKEESETLVDLYQATSRLTKLNQSLLLLVKIDNNLMNDQENIDVVEIIEQRIIYFQELVQKRNLSLITILKPASLFASRQLFEILVNNLFSNAIRHNYDGGTIHITLNQNSLIFCNTGKQSELDKAKIFERFYKDNASDGTGMGLAILKQVCNRNDFPFNYEYNKQQHCFTINFCKKDRQQQ